jgi:hypothetical protein
MRCMKLLYVAGLMFSTSALAQEIFEPEALPRRINTTRTNEKIIIDGKLIEKSWSAAENSSDFFQVFPDQGKPLDADTEVRVLYDSQYLYIAAFCHNRYGLKSLRAPSFRRDHDVGNHDVFGVSVDGFRDKRNAMVFTTDPWSTQRDVLSFDDEQYDQEWDGLWKVRTQRNDTSWTAEFQIPWETLRYEHSETSHAQWGVQFYRIQRSNNEGSTWAPMPRVYAFFRMSYEGVLDSLQPPPPGRNLRVQPYALFAKSAAGDQHHGSAKAGGEMKWLVNSNSVIDLTLNTDFAQADVDRQVNNLSRFNIYFPERRQFFLENAALLGPGLAPLGMYSGGSMRIYPFFTRRIGLNSAGKPIPINAGLRYVHRSAKQNYGAMYIRQDRDEETPPANYFLGRYSRNLGMKNRVGSVLITRVTDDSQREITAGIDGMSRLNQQLSFSYMGILNNKPIPGANNNSFGGYARLHYLSNALNAYWTQSYIDQHFNPSTGFVSRTNVIATTPGFYVTKKTTLLPKFIRFFEPGIFVEMYHQASTKKLQELTINFNPVWLTLHNGGYVGYILTRSRQEIIETFYPSDVAIAPGSYVYNRHLWMYSTDLSRRISFAVALEHGSYYNGKLLTTDLTFNFAPAPYIYFSLNHKYNEFNKVGENLTSADVHLLTCETRLALNPRVQLIGFLQRNTLGSMDNWNVRFAWEYKPLSFLYLVFNRRRSKIDATDQNLLAKFSYVKQF